MAAAGFGVANDMNRNVLTCCVVALLGAIGSVLYAQQRIGKPEGGIRPAPIEKTLPAAPTLSPADQRRYEAGKGVYQTSCAVCHQDDGRGLTDFAPPLAGSEWVKGSPERLVRILLQGMKGPVTVGQTTYDLDMPAFDSLDDEQMADVLTYIRREWGYATSAVSTVTVRQIRAATGQRSEPWTALELLKLP